MSDLMNEQKRYLEARLKSCMTKPELNKNQIPEYRKYLDMLASSKDANEYADNIASSGDMFSISQAEQLDCYENLLKIRRLFGDKHGASAEEMRISAARNSTSHMDLYEKMKAASDKASDIINTSRQTVEHVMNLFIALVAYKTGCTARKASKKSAARNIWDKLKSLDPEISFEKLVSYPPYRSVLVFDDERIHNMKAWLQEVLQ